MIMEQMNVPEESKVIMDFERREIPRNARELQPLVFKEGDSYCCVLGADPERGIMGCGNTPIESVQDWDDQLVRYLHLAGSDDELALYIRDVLNADKKDVW
jgi:hypothetical protein